MTLVVARTTPLGVRMIADMRISDPGAVRSGFLNGAQLKIVLLSPTICVGYAGNVGGALAAIRSVNVEAGVAAVEELLLRAHARSDCRFDFLVGSLEPVRLVLIHSGRSDERPAGWIGDATAFAEYQEHYFDQANFQPPSGFYESADREADLNIANGMGAGMAAVVFGPSMTFEGGKREVLLPAGGKHGTVGEAMIAAGPRVEDNRFAYFHQNRATAPFGSAAGGGFSYYVLTPGEPGLAAVGIYFAEGRLGVLYAPLLLDDPERERYPDVSVHEFIEEVARRHDLHLHGLLPEP